MQNSIKDLKKIAQDSLKACVSESGYIAGVHHFVDLWARDSLFACLGDLQSNATWNTLTTFKRFQRSDGLIPYRVRRSSLNMLKYFGKPLMLKTPVADFRSYQSLDTVMDGGVVYILVASMRILENKSIDEFKKLKNSINKAVMFYREKFNCDLISEGYLTEWADAVLKRGHISYTNIIYVAALKKWIELLKLISNLYPESKENLDAFELLFKNVKQQLYEKLWNGKYFADYFLRKRHDYLATHPNLLAINLGITTEEETKSIIAEIEKKNLRKIGVTSNSPKYPWYMIPIQNYLTGTADYHNGIFWLQPWILYIGGLIKQNQKTKAYNQLELLFNTIKEHRVIYENYERNWKPLNRLLYKAEGPFAWSSGLLLWIINELN